MQNPVVPAENHVRLKNCAGPHVFDYTGSPHVCRICGGTLDARELWAYVAGLKHAVSNPQLAATYVERLTQEPPSATLGDRLLALVNGAAAEPLNVTITYTENAANELTVESGAAPTLAEEKPAGYDNQVS